jgi:tRNA pseudouridine55 synthase
VEKEHVGKYERGQVVLINKPPGWTSFDVVRKIRNLTGVSKVGHAGTLDPLATGLLILCTGRFTKEIQSYMSQEKEYTGSFTLGATTPTYDLESEPVDFREIGHLTTEAVGNMTTNFTGRILQVPPPHSAIKKDGKRAYELARKGLEVRLEPREITISAFEITRIEWPLVYFRVTCSTGTYIRSLAHDFGKALGCGAYLSQLCRTRIGSFLLKDARTIEEFEAETRQEGLARRDS